MISHGGDVKIIDFGLAWIKGESKDRVQGTPEYMAPEQARKGLVNERTDIYNFGATMYRLVTWRLPPNVLSMGEEDVPVDAKTWKRMLKPVHEFAPEAPRCWAISSTAVSLSTPSIGRSESRTSRTNCMNWPGT